MYTYLDICICVYILLVQIFAVDITQYDIINRILY